MKRKEEELQAKLRKSSQNNMVLIYLRIVNIRFIYFFVLVTYVVPTQSIQRVAKDLQ